MTQTKPDAEITPTRARAITWLRNAAPRSLAIIAAGLFLAGLYLTSLYSYLLFHTLAEMFSIIVSGAGSTSRFGRGGVWRREWCFLSGSA